MANNRSLPVSIRQVFFAMLFLAAHVGTAFVVLRFMSGNGIVATFWPPSGIALAGLMLGGLRYAPLIFVSASLVNWLIGGPWYIAMLLGAVNLGEALFGYWLLRFVRPIQLQLNRARDFFRLFLYAGFLSPIPSAIFGAVILKLTALTAQTWLQNFQFWWMGDSLGIIVVAPLVLIWRRVEKIELRRAQIYEGVIALLLAFLTGQILYLGWFVDWLGFHPRAFMMFIFVTWAAVRFGRHATLVVLFMVIAQMLFGMMQQTGYFFNYDRHMQLFNTWLYITVLAASGMALATFIHERKRSLEKLSRVTENLEQISATAHVGGWDLNVATQEIRFSSEAMRIVDMSPGEHLSLTQAMAFLSPEDQVAHAQRVHNAITQHVAWDTEFAMTTATGRRIWVRSQGRPVLQDGQTVRLVGTVHDLTYRRKAEQALSESNERLQLIFGTLAEGVSLNEIVTDSNGVIIDHRVLEVNEAFYKMADYNKEIPVIGALASQLYSLSSDMIRTFWEKHSNATETVHSELFSQISRRYFIIATSPLRNGRFITSFIDITERKKTELALAESEARYRRLVESSADAILVHQGGLIVYVNPALVKILRAQSANELVHTSVTRIVPMEYRAMILERTALGEDGRETLGLVESKFHCFDGELIDVEISTVETIFNNQPSTMVVARDISERKRAEEQIRYLGQHDILTGLPNRALFADRLSQAITFAGTHRNTFALLFLDVDHFKKINDSLGHHYGDIFLKEITRRLLATVKSIDTVSRQGGDEFLILLNELTHPEEAALVAQKICAALAEPVLVENSRMNSSVSIGIAVFPRDGDTPEALIKNADIAMYHAKDSGRNQFQYFSEELNRITRENLDLETALREAIALGQLEVYYQPQLNLQTGIIESCEALLRWKHPQWGMVSPARFIPLAEESGQIFEIGRWVLASVAERYSALMNAGFPNIRISVNVSAPELQSPTFAADIENTIRHYGMPAANLEMEVTESLIMEDTASASVAIRQLSALGVRFSIDDFGTGYSSLSYLRQLHIHNLKIDQSFVRDIMNDPNDAVIVQAIIGLAKNLNLQVTAEGVEDDAQKNFLRENGCDLMQGFLLSAALPFPDFLALLQSRGAQLA